MVALQWVGYPNGLFSIERPVHIIYLHGFCSSMASFKAQLVKNYIEQTEGFTLFLSDLPPSPAEAMSLIESHINSVDHQPWAVIGSSLGGFYATYLSEKYGRKGVLINPAVHAPRLLEKLLGKNKNYHTGEVFDFTQQHLKELKAMYVPVLKQPQNLLLLTQTGDEVLDFQQGVDYYQGSEQVVIEGGDHGFSDYENYLDTTFDFLS
ncbi:MAG: YqiA/YcfP family alpha/beta fold hydrolase [Cycloclasticus sp.]